MPSPVKRLRMTPAQIEALRQYAEQQGMSESDVIRLALSLLIDDFPDDEMYAGKRTDLKPTEGK